MDVLEVDYEELRAAARTAFDVADDLGVLGRAEPLLRRESYDWPLVSPAGRFAARYGHLVRGLGRSADDAGEVLRTAAWAYEADDLLAPAPFGRLGEGLTGGAASTGALV